MAGRKLPGLCSLSGKQYEGRKTKECDAPLSRHKFIFERHFLSFSEGKEAMKMKEEEENKKLQKKAAASSSSPAAFSATACVAAQSGAALLCGQSLPPAVLRVEQPAPHSTSLPPALPPRPVLQAMTEMTDADLAEVVARIEATG